jgi:hypothetical protein
VTRPKAFVHVDLDNLWAIADCYGVRLTPDQRDLVYADALPRLRDLFARHGVRATLFVLGRDLESEANVALLRELKEQGHVFANHGYSHNLAFRALDEPAIEEEVARTEALLSKRLGVHAGGFRAPGYGVSPALLRVLTRRNYRYDSSLMPSPYGPVFRMLDRRIGGGETPAKTQYSRIGEARAPLKPYHVSPEDPLREAPGAPLLEVPVATSPFLRLPFQAGVCMRLGRGYFSVNLRAFRRKPDLPLVFLLHAADAADFNSFGIPFFSMSSFFKTSINRKLEMLDWFFSEIAESHEVGVLEESLAS